ncbi:MAG: isocitrate/isopropylmalate family dehydrogenase, partial [Planctomycetota bacterium]
MSYHIAVLPGDGIGPEIMDAAMVVLERLQADMPALSLAFTSHAAGAAHHRDHGEALPKAVLDDCLAADAVFLAAIGLPEVRSADGTEVQPQKMMGLRRPHRRVKIHRPAKAHHHL